MQEQNDALAVGRGRACPLRPHTMSVDGLDPDIRRQGVASPEAFDPGAPLSEIGRSRMRGEAGSDHVDVTRRHVSLPT
ncbi:hypothetical protein GCM10007886_26810 [Methylobacterium gregans]|nr:hypothetical protein GCM10007886_26810 [Methylobacterium gregans]